MRKSMGVLWGIIFIAAGLTGCAHSNPQNSDSRFVTIKIYHTNDVHSHLLPNSEGRGGLAYVASVLKVVRKQDPDALILDAGDFYKKGSIPARKTDDEITAQIISNFPYNYRAVGNNELKVGIEKFLEYAGKYESGRVLSANFVDKDENLIFPPFVEIKNQGLKIAIIALTHSFALEKDVQPQSDKDPRAPYKVLPPEQALRKYLPELRSRNDVVLILDHIGYKPDKKLAQLFGSDIDAIIGGHSHSLTKEFDGPISSTPIVQGGEYGQQVGVLQLVFDRTAKKFVRAQSSFWSVGESFQVPDPVVQEQILKAYKKHAPDAFEVVGKVGQRLDLIDDNNPLEGGYHDWVADLMKKYSKAQVALLNREALREPLRAGPLNRDQLWMATPYQDELAVVELTAEKFKKLVKTGVQKAWEKSSLFPYAFSGASVTVDRAKAGQFEVIGFNLPTTKKFKVVMPKYAYTHCEEIFFLSECTEKLTPVKASLQSVQLDEFKKLKEKKLMPPKLDRVRDESQMTKPAESQGQ